MYAKELSSHFVISPYFVKTFQSASMAVSVVFKVGAATLLVFDTLCFLWLVVTKVATYFKPKLKPLEKSSLLHLHHSWRWLQLSHEQCEVSKKHWRVLGNLKIIRSFVLRLRLLDCGQSSEILSWNPSWFPCIRICNTRVGVTKLSLGETWGERIYQDYFGDFFWGLFWGSFPIWRLFWRLFFSENNCQI